MSAEDVIRRFINGEMQVRSRRRRIPFVVGGKTVKAERKPIKADQPPGARALPRTHGRRSVPYGPSSN